MMLTTLTHFTKRFGRACRSGISARQWVAIWIICAFVSPLTLMPVQAVPAPQARVDEETIASSAPTPRGSSASLDAQMPQAQAAKQEPPPQTTSSQPLPDVKAAAVANQQKESLKIAEKNHRTAARAKSHRPGSAPAVQTQPLTEEQVETLYLPQIISAPRPDRSRPILRLRQPH